MPDKRDDFLRYNLEHMESIYVTSAEEGLVFPFIVGLDLRAELAKKIAISRTSAEEVEKRMQDCIVKGVEPCLIFSMPYDDSCSFFRGFSQASDSFLATSVPSGYFKYLIITTDGHRFGTARIPT